MDPFREYQDYVIAHRLREALDFFPGKLYSLCEYATLRLRRSELVRKLVGRQGDPALLSRIEQISDEINFGFWSNPGLLKAFLKRLPPQQYPVLHSPEAFETLLSHTERLRLKEPGLAGRYYLGWLRLPALLDEPSAFEQAMLEQEHLAEALGLFLDEFHKVAGSG
ncbi:hypothetical protein [Meiothermus ruber]|uniref:Uncharacterized protein n=1 Tax=Meiothermus ruber (strain ATCC 35948 / DSM 1279 / VKM B-1258 / 21) TaxID=504728 RepID=D3PP42_MEIRD|nr:hypothetical protein [Meiothermus ruber]ADD27451.1 hypothetical protein Mrub_0684 [Meiothermus ruber DSM 1279]AGK03916.1 hypothetical protein K649_03070 [Meiothermus ruber DSM 1279]MCL6530501.1 hypothetical protein [Meiothermus ruber]MCX7801447.1 hypothetical protein [Meiothermus ruber]GAO74378.1 putative uncharacterized protein [Meiothermus ruber H328]